MPATRILELDEYEHRLIVNSLNDKRNEMIEEGRDTDFVDDVLLEVIDAPTKKQKRRHEDFER